MKHEHDFDQDHDNDPPSEVTVAGCTAPVRLVPFLRATREEPSEGGHLEITGPWTLTDLEALREECSIDGTWDHFSAILGTIEGAQLPELAEVFFAEVFRDEIEEVTG